MGLDMYLYVKKYLSAFDNAKQVEELRKQFDVPASGNLESVEIKFEVGYWRKANQIHKWFVENVQDGEDDCGNYDVPIEKMKELLKLVTLLLKDKDEKKAGELLPPSEGFFFGNGDINEDYWEDLKDTEQMLSKLLVLNKLEEKGWEFEYHSSW